MQMLKEFKEFAMRGNVLIWLPYHIGAAFGTTPPAGADVIAADRPIPGADFTNLFASSARHAPGPHLALADAKAAGRLC
jgi:large-conductance mechanosensitive channel